MSKMRFLLLTFAILLFLQSAWILTPEFFRTRLPYFPTTKAQVAEFSDARENAGRAAKSASFRGDLWTEFALAMSTPFLDGGSAPAQEMIAQDREIAEQAARLAPYDARAWLLLADINYKFGTDKDNAASQLKMSFYTAPNERRLVPLRLLLASRSTQLDDEIQNLIEHDVHLITGQTDLKPALLAAYNAASPMGRDFVEKKLAVIDPQLLAELRQPPR